MAAKRGISLKDLYGRRFISPELARRSMVELERRLTADFKERARLRTLLEEQIKRYRAPLLDVVSRDQASAKAAVREMRRLHKAARARKLRRPQRVKLPTGIFTGPIAATVAPPYDYQWTWNAVSGKAGLNYENADRRSGDITIYLDTDDGNSSTVSGRGAVGIYFYPPMANGTLRIWSSPAFNDDWWTYCALDSAHADGWIGLYVGSYDLAGAPTGAVVDQKATLWSDDSWWVGAGERPLSNSGYGLYAPPIQVDQNHQYIIWVWCGGEVSGDGSHLFYGSLAGDSMEVVVPSMTWELQPLNEIVYY